MPTLYDNYQLANSNQVRQFQGSTLPEMIKVSDAMQQRYDASELGMEGLGAMMKNAKVLSKDQGLFNERSKEYQTMLDQWSKRQDLENLPKDIAKAGRGFAGEYKNFADNLQRAQQYQKELDDQVEKKLISRQTADNLLAMSHDQYKGMQYDKASGKYQGQFSGASPAREVDLNEWVKKVAGDIAASKNGTLVESPQGDYFIKKGNSTERITKQQIDAAITSAMNNDLELQSDMKQRMGIASWRERRTLEDFDAPTQKKIQEEADKQGVSAGTYLKNLAAINTGKDLEANLRNLGYKYAYTKSESSFEYDGFTTQGHRKANDNGAPMLAISSTTPGPGTVITSAADFTQLKGTTQKEHDDLMKTYADWKKQQKLQGKGLVDGVGGKIYRIEKDGSRTDVTDEANDFRIQLAQKRKDLDMHDAIDKAAKQASGFNEKDATLLKHAQEAYDKAYNRSYGAGDVAKGGRTKEERETEGQAAFDKVIKAAPTYSKYVEELQKRVNPNALSGTMLMINDKATKEMWSENITALTSQLGLKDGMLSFKIGSGPDQGKDLTAGDYKDIKGKVEVVGFDTDANGKTVLKLRAFEDIRGSKTKGENLVLNLGSTNVDTWLADQVERGKLDPGQLAQFKDVGWLKGQLNNNYKANKIKIPGTDKDAEVVSRDGKWIVSLPTAFGKSEQTATSYEGILQILAQASKEYQ